jgi:hypothetical protein
MRVRSSRPANRSNHPGSNWIAWAVVFITLAGCLNGCGPARLTLSRVDGSADGAVLSLGEAGRFDERWVTCPTVTYDGSTYRMLYSSLYDSKMGRGGIGLATSRDGIHWKRANGGRAVLEVGSPGALDDGQVMGPEVLYDGRVYRMWYTGMARSWHESGLGYYRIFLAESTDGVHWERRNGGNPVLDVGPPGSYDAVQAATPSILKEADGYRMWYAAWSPQHGHTICVARSTDGIHWHRERDGRPIEGLPHAEVFGHAVTWVDDQYLLLYMTLSRDPGGPGLYGAVSSDGRRWRPLNDGEPVLSVGAEDAFDAYHVGHAFAMDTGGLLRLWYTGYQRDAEGVRGLVLRIGLAKGRLDRQ